MLSLVLGAEYAEVAGLADVACNMAARFGDERVVVHLDQVRVRVRVRRRRAPRP